MWNKLPWPSSIYPKTIKRDRLQNWWSKLNNFSLEVYQSIQSYFGNIKFMSLFLLSSAVTNPSWRCLIGLSFGRAPALCSLFNKRSSSFSCSWASTLDDLKRTDSLIIYTSSICNEWNENIIVQPDISTWTPQGTSKNSDICKGFRSFWLNFYSGGLWEKYLEA